MRGKSSKRMKGHRQQVGGGMRFVAYALLWVCIVLPLWMISLNVQAHYLYVPPMWLGLWPWWGPTLAVLMREVWLMRK